MKIRIIFCMMICLTLSTIYSKSHEVVHTYHVTSSKEIPVYEYEMSNKISRYDKICWSEDEVYYVIDSLATDTISVFVTMAVYPDDNRWWHIRMAEKSKVRNCTNIIATNVFNNTIKNELLKGYSSSNFNLIHQQEVQNIMELTKKITKEEVEEMQSYNLGDTLYVQYIYLIIPKFY